MGPFRPRSGRNCYSRNIFFIRISRQEVLYWKKSAVEHFMEFPITQPWQIIFFKAHYTPPPYPSQLQCYSRFPLTRKVSELSSPNIDKYDQKKFWIWTLFIQCTQFSPFYHLGKSSTIKLKNFGSITQKCAVKNLFWKTLPNWWGTTNKSPFLVNLLA